MERQTKTRHGDEHEQYSRAFHPKAYATGDEKCPVHCYKQFVSRRPVVGKTPESPFFLAINHRRRPEDKVWFLDRPMGKKQDRAIPVQRNQKCADHQWAEKSVITPFVKHA